MLTTLKRFVLATTVLGFAAHAVAADLTLDVYNPGESAIFPVSSVLVSGEKDAILVDAQFGKGQAEQLVQKIRASGKQLTTIYISAAEPQAYFGLGVLQEAFPQARILASCGTVAAIRREAGARVAHWGGILKHNAPRRIVLPQCHDGASLPLEGRQIALRHLDAACQ